LGGQSLVVIQVMVRIKALYDIDISARMFFSHSTISNIAIYIDSIIQNRMNAEIFENEELETGTF
ncbi:phosphopantetheine-binding protein, partial [Pseudoalteromonas sp. MMG007]|uniref:acyl carrier protein n=1 Tax=Pseudoalteromonas sp. MMG007 TaxID=2822684 RepID=UPI001B35BC57